MIKLTETREITPYVWVHPNAEVIRIIWSVPLARRAYARFSCGCLAAGICCTVLREKFTDRSAGL